MSKVVLKAGEPGDCSITVNGKPMPLDKILSIRVKILPCELSKITLELIADEVEIQTDNLNANWENISYDKS